MTNYLAGLNVLSGAVAKDTLAAAYDFTDNEAGSNLTVASANLSSDYGVVYSGGKDTCYVKIHSLTLNASSTLTNMLASFTKKLLPGRSYTLQINFRKGIAFAGSNIYWDAEKECLTFKEAGYKGIENNYQGVFFKFGSLVGVSPANLPSGSTFNGGTNGDPDTGTPIYLWSPAAGKWIQTNVATASNSSAGGFTGPAANGETTHIAWERIPYTDTGSATDRNSNYLYTADDFANNRGDICKYIGEKTGPQGYRMAKSIEFGASVESWSYDSPTTPIGWTRLGPDIWNTFSDTSYPGGTKSDISAGGSYQTYPFPASGRRISNGLLGGTGDGGYYWSGSVSNNRGYLLDFYSGDVSPDYPRDRQYGVSVRCVLRE
jgi:hypothetical protein